MMVFVYLLADILQQNCCIIISTALLRGLNTEFVIAMVLMHVKDVTSLSFRKKTICTNVLTDTFSV